MEEKSRGRSGEPGTALGQRDPAQGERIFCDGGAPPPVEVMVGFIDDQQGKHGVEPICRVLPIAPSTYYDHLAKRANSARLSDRSRRDAALRPEIERVFEENWRVYGVRKVRRLSYPQSPRRDPHGSQAPIFPHRTWRSSHQGRWPSQRQLP